MKNTARPPNVIVSAGGSGMVSQAGALLLTQVLQVTGLRRRLSEGLEGWRAARAIHDPGKIIADLAVALALGGTAWPMWPCCGNSLRCSGRWRLIR